MGAAASLHQVLLGTINLIEDAMVSFNRIVSNVTEFPSYEQIVKQILRHILAK